MIALDIILLIGVCLVIFGLGVTFGFLISRTKAETVATASHQEEIDRLRTVLLRAGIVLDDQLPGKLDESVAESRSWTGIPIPDEVHRPVGTIPRWDEPSHHAVEIPKEQ